MTTEASCHCGAVRIFVPHAPAQVTDCNCSICRRLGALWAYYPAAEVRIDAAADAFDRYVRNDGPPGHADWKPLLAFLSCASCGCVTHWAPLDPSGERMGVNARLFSPAILAAARIRRLDGADTWRELD